VGATIGGMSGDDPGRKQIQNGLREGVEIAPRTWEQRK